MAAVDGTAGGYSGWHFYLVVVCISRKGFWVSDNPNKDFRRDSNRDSKGTATLLVSL
jgi:hypothetical protein